MAVTLLIFVSSQQKAPHERIPTGRAIEPRSISALVHAANIGLPLPQATRLSRATCGLQRQPVAGLGAGPRRWRGTLLTTGSYARTPASQELCVTAFFFSHFSPVVDRKSPPRRSCHRRAKPMSSPRNGCKVDTIGGCRSCCRRQQSGATRRLLDSARDTAPSSRYISQASRSCSH
jgi:hypothetical protein